LKTIRCRTFGGVRHSEPIEAKPGSKHGVRLRNVDPELIASVKVRSFDGADTSKFFDELAQNIEPPPQGEAARTFGPSGFSERIG